MFTGQLDGQASEEEAFFMERLRIDGETFALNSSLQKVFFDQDSFAISKEAKIALEANIEWLKAYPHITHLILEGHCDSLGSENYNKSLGLKRAESVKAYLQLHGISGEILDPVSYGETRPLSDAITNLNRRVEFVPIK